MSIDILGIIPNKSVSYFTKIFNMDIRNEISLADYVRQTRNNKGLSTTKVEEISKRGGNKGISDGYVSQIEAGLIENVSPSKLKALAKGLGESEEIIFAVARGVSPKQEIISNERFAKIAEGYMKLTLEERNSLEPLLMVIETTINRSTSYEQTEKKEKDTITAIHKGPLADDTKKAKTQKDLKKIA